MINLLEKLLSCPPHGNVSRIFTNPKTKEQYQVCFDCGKVLQPKVKL